MTNIRHFRQWKGGNSREVCEQETAEGDHYPLLPALGEGKLRRGLRTKDRRGRPLSATCTSGGEGKPTRGLRTRGRRG
jgi:hypothetical protein